MDLYYLKQNNSYYKLKPVKFPKQLLKKKDRNLYALIYFLGCLSLIAGIHLSWLRLLLFHHINELSTIKQTNKE